MSNSSSLLHRAGGSSLQSPLGARANTLSNAAAAPAQEQEASSSDAGKLRHGRDLTRLVWRWQQWLDACCPTPAASTSSSSSSLGGLTTPELAWAYFRESDAFDKTSDNWSLFVQFGDDPAYGWARMMADLSKMTGGTPQYHISPLSRPPDLWIFNKVQRRKRTEAQPSSSSAASVVGGAGEAYELLEVVAIVQGDISVVRSFEEVVGARLLSVNHALSRSLEALRSRAPPASVRQLDFWKSRPIQARQPTGASGKAADEAADVDMGEVGVESAPASSQAQSAAATRRKKPERGPDLAMLRAIETLRRDLSQEQAGAKSDEATLPSDEKRIALELANQAFRKTDRAMASNQASRARKRQAASPSRRAGKTMMT